MNTTIIKVAVNGLVLPFIFMLCWNYSFSIIFSIKEINFLQSILINIMFNILLRNRKDIIKEDEEEKIKKDIERVEVLFEKYTERVRGIKNYKGEKENES